MELIFLSSYNINCVTHTNGYDNALSALEYCAESTLSIPRAWQMHVGVHFSNVASTAFHGYGCHNIKFHGWSYKSTYRIASPFTLILLLVEYRKVSSAYNFYFI